MGNLYQNTPLTIHKRKRKNFQSRKVVKVRYNPNGYESSTQMADNPNGKVDVKSDKLVENIESSPVAKSSLSLSISSTPSTSSVVFSLVSF